MLNLAVVIVHNGTNAQNEALINAILSKVEVINVPYTDPDTQETVDVLHYEVTALNREHWVKFYQVIPFGVTPPSNLDSLNSHKVFYGTGDENKTGTHPRFFNWSFRRATDYGADVVVYIDNASQLTAARLRNALDKLVNDVEFTEEQFGKVGTVRLFRLIGQLKEDRNFVQAITDYKARILQGGLNYG